MLDDDVQLCRLTANDLAAALELSVEAGWNQTVADWRTLIELGPNTCLGIKIRGQLVSTSTLICYGQRLGWIGMVLTRSSHRGQGYAKRLLTETLRISDELGIASVKLDATDQGQPLYEKIGFRTEQPVERWERKAHQSRESSEEASSGGTNIDFAADQAAFGADRSSLLRKLSQNGRGYVRDHPFLLTRSGRTHRYLGPCVSDSFDDARTLIDDALRASSECNWYWDMLTNNTNVVGLARDFGFTPKRHLLRMVRGDSLRGSETNIYSLAGFEFG